MLVEKLKEHRSHILKEFNEIMNFKAFTTLAYIFASDYAKQHPPHKTVSLPYTDSVNPGEPTNKSISFSSLPEYFIEVQDKYLFSLIHQHQVSLFEHLYFDLLRLILENRPQHLSGNKQIDYTTILNASTKEEIISELINRDLNSLKYKSIKDWFNYLKDLVSIPDVSEEDKQKIVEAKAKRDLLVHHAGIVDQTYLKKVGSATDLSLGEQIDITSEYTTETWKVFHRVLVEIINSIINKYEKRTEI